MTPNRRKIMSAIAGLTLVGGGSVLPIIPTPMTWVQSEQYDVYNTPSGKLDAGYYHVEDDGTITYAQQSATSSAVTDVVVKQAPDTAIPAIKVATQYENVYVDSTGKQVLQPSTATEYQSLSTSGQPVDTQLVSPISLVTGTAHAAIGFGATTTGQGSGVSSITFTSPTESGSNTIGFLEGLIQTNLTWGTPTWGGTNMTVIGTQANTASFNNESIGLWYIVNPTSASNIVLSRTGSSNAIQGIATYYTGANQTGQPDASHITTAVSGTTLVSSVTVVNANSWTILAFRDDNGLGTASTNSIFEGASAGGSSSAGTQDYDNRANVSAGSYSMTISGLNCAAGEECYSIMASFQPVAVAASNPPNAPWQVMIGR